MDPTQRVPLGETRLTVTRLGLGSAPLGGLFRPVEAAEARAVVDRAYDLGLRFFDTAPLYGHGLSERHLGGALASRPRDEFVLATKVGRLLRADLDSQSRADHPNRGQFKGTPTGGLPTVSPIFDYSYDAVMRSVEESLERLGLDRIDVLHIHDPDDHFYQALEGAFPALDRLRSEGTIGAVGAGMNQAQMLARLARAADFDCFLLAGRYTLLDHDTALDELLPLCVEKGISIVIGGVYNSGLLADPREGATFNYKPAAQHRIERARRLAAVCDRHNVPLKAAAIQFPLAHPAVASVLTGARSVAELAENERMFRLEIPAALWHDLRAEGLLPENAPIPAG